MASRRKEIWAIILQREGNLDEAAFGLVAEARHLASEHDGEGVVTALVLGSGSEAILKPLGNHGSDRILFIKNDALIRYSGELFAKLLYDKVTRDEPSYLLMAQSKETADLSSRLAALMNTSLVNRVVDFKIGPDGKGIAVRPVSNGYLFERLRIESARCPIICFLPSVLSEFDPDPKREAHLTIEEPDVASLSLVTRIEEIIEADPEDLDIEEADIVVSGGRGVGKGDSFHVIHELAQALGGAVGGTRPIIDWQILPFERQIGQTGKTVVPRLLLACGISGANEYTAGMEKSHLVIAVNKDSRARIFRFADLSVIGDVHEVIPRLIEELKQNHESESD